MYSSDSPAESVTHILFEALTREGDFQFGKTGETCALVATNLMQRINEFLTNFNGMHSPPETLFKLPAMLKVDSSNRHRSEILQFT